MTRIVLGIACVLLLAACGGSGGGSPVDSGDDAAKSSDAGTTDATAQETKTRVDAVVTTLLKDLDAQLGGQAHVRAAFTTCRMTSQQRYSGNGQVVRPTLGADEIPDALETAFADAGLDVRRDGADVEGTADDLTLRVSGVDSLGKTAVPVLTITFDTECAEYADADWAEAAGFTDLPG